MAKKKTEVIAEECEAELETDRLLPINYHKCGQCILAADSELGTRDKLFRRWTLVWAGVTVGIGNLVLGNV
jgi:hypothetical protein